MTQLIAEIGLNHFGDMATAKTMILAAIDSGADSVKSQAGSARAFAANGSMQASFYEQAALSLEECIELIYFAREYGTELFFSIFSSDYHALMAHQLAFKISGTQTRMGMWRDYDSPYSFISIPTSMAILPNIEMAVPLHVTPYLTDVPRLERIEELSEYYSRPAGYSDHTVGIKNCIDAIELHGAKFIEKHFTLEKDKSFNRRIFRDTVHGASPEEFYELAKHKQGD